MVRQQGVSMPKDSFTKSGKKMKIIMFERNKYRQHCSNGI